MQALRKVLCDPARLLIIEALAEEELCVGDLSLAIERAPAATSQHLRVLRELELVASRRRGTSVYYRLTPAAAERLQAVLSTITASAPRAAER
jgi:ArsR family transcriptional regulator